MLLTLTPGRRHDQEHRHLEPGRARRADRPEERQTRRRTDGPRSDRREPERPESGEHDRRALVPSCHLAAAAPGCKARRGRVAGAHVLVTHGS